MVYYPIGYVFFASFYNLKLINIRQGEKSIPKVLTGMDRNIRSIIAFTLFWRSDKYALCLGKPK